MLQNPHRYRCEGYRRPRKAWPWGRLAVAAVAGGSSGLACAKKFARHAPSNAPPAKKFAHHARKHQFWAIMTPQGELFRAHTHHQTTQGELYRPQEAATWRR